MVHVLCTQCPDVTIARYARTCGAALRGRAPCASVDFAPAHGIHPWMDATCPPAHPAPRLSLPGSGQVWKRDPWNMAGFYPRLHLLDKDCKWVVRINLNSGDVFSNTRGYVTGAACVVGWPIYTRGYVFGVHPAPPG